MARCFRENKIEKVDIDWNAIKPDGTKHACYILITCAHPNAEGKMNVEMTYEGDAALASYLLENAQNYLEEGETFA